MRLVIKLGEEGKGVGEGVEDVDEALLVRVVRQCTEDVDEDTGVERRRRGGGRSLEGELRIKSGMRDWGNGGVLAGWRIADEIGAGGKGEASIRPCVRWAVCGYVELCEGNGWKVVCEMRCWIKCLCQEAGQAFFLPWCCVEEEGGEGDMIGAVCTWVQ